MSKFSNVGIPDEYETAVKLDNQKAIKKYAKRSKTEDLISGSVSFFNSKLGYGFIDGEDGVNYFVHYSGLNGSGFKKLDKGQPVMFLPHHTNRGISAVDVYY